MNSFIDFIMGPMLWISIVSCVGGIFFKMVQIYRQTKQKEGFMFSYLSLWYGLRSIAAWLIPFFPVSTRNQPVFWGLSYVFHVSLFLVPLFFSAHLVLFNQAFGIEVSFLNAHVADTLTIAVMVALAFFAFRRMSRPEVAFLTTKTDYALIIMVALPFVSGFVAYHQLFLYDWMFILHVLSGELMLIMIPFTRFSHMILAPLTRAYMGSEFGKVRHARDW